MSSILSLENVSKFYVNGQNVVVGVQNIHLSMRIGEFIAITGESGSGKSTLAGVLGGTLPYESGEMLLNGEPTSPYDETNWENYRRDQIAYISQNYGILPGLSVEENVESALRLLNLNEKETVLKTEQILKQVDLWAQRKRHAGKLSSGQKQRLSIARALAKPAPILIADEPTGNLDSANSEKVIELLKKSASDRLVIIITHEFSEVKDYATRHIQMQDGKIAMDAPLSEPTDSSFVFKPTASASKKPLAPYIAKIQMRARPIWCIVMALLMFLTSVATFSFLGTALKAWDDTNTRIYDDSCFPNGSPLRLVVQKQNKAAFDETDFERISQIRHVQKLERYGYISDVNYAYRPQEDYLFNSSVINIGSPAEPVYITQKHIVLTNPSLFVESVPVSSHNLHIDGRLPQNAFEVISRDKAYQIGDAVTIHFLDTKTWSVSAFVTLDAIVVGTVDEGPDGCGFYFADSIAHTLSDAVRGYSEIYWPASPGPIGDGCVLVESKFYGALREEARPAANETFMMPITSHKEEPTSLEVIGAHSFFALRVFVVNEPTMLSLLTEGYGDQISITLSSYAYKDLVINSLSKQGYQAISPYTICSTELDYELYAERIQTLLISLGITLGILVLQALAITALFSAQTDNFLQLSNIGLTFKTARRSIILQLLFFILIGQALASVFILLTSALYQPPFSADIFSSSFSDSVTMPLSSWTLWDTVASNIQSLSEYFRFHHILILCLVHAIGTLSTSLLIANSLRKRVFPHLRRFSDLNWALIEEGASR